MISVMDEDDVNDDRKVHSPPFQISTSLNHRCHLLERVDRYSMDNTERKWIEK